VTIKVQDWKPGVWHCTFTIGSDLTLNYGTLDLISPGQTDLESFFGWSLTRAGQPEPVANAGVGEQTTLAGLREWVALHVPAELIGEAMETAREAFEEMPRAFTGEPLRPLVERVRISAGPYSGAVVPAPQWREEIHAIPVADVQPAEMTLWDRVLVESPSRVDLNRLWIDTPYEARCRDCLEVAATSGLVTRAAS